MYKKWEELEKAQYITRGWLNASLPFGKCVLPTKFA